MTSLTINEIFYSIQGEGMRMGQPTIFIRTTGCNLRCIYCDTPQAYDKGTSQTIEDILKNIKKYPCTQVCITGGEPLLQDNITTLFEKLSKNHYEIIVETNGSLSIQPFLSINNLNVSVDIKCPSSTMHHKTDFSNIPLLRPTDQVKCIIGNHDDYIYAKEIIKKYEPNCKIYFQPMWGFSLSTLASWILSDHLSVSLGIQLHKYIWGEDTRK